MGWPLAGHVLALVAVVVVVAPWWHLDAPFTSDEGAYAWQVAALDEGSWADPFARPGLPWNENTYPLANSTASLDGQNYPYVKHPLWPVTLRAAAAGDPDGAGLYLPSAALAVAGAALAWALAGALAPGGGRVRRVVAFWLAAAGPLLVHGGLLWAHAASAAAAGAAILAGLRLLERGLRPAPAVVLAGAIAGGVLVRAEGLLLAIALAIGLAVGSWRAGRRPAAAGLVALTLLPAVAAAVIERVWIDAIVPSTTGVVHVRQGQTDRGWLLGRITGAWHEVFGASYGEPMSGALGLVAAIGAVFAMRGMARRVGSDAVAGTALAVVCLGARLLLYGDEPITGLVTAWPVAVAAAVVALWRRPTPALSVLGLTGALYIGAVLLTQYPEGGGLEWGGRFFSPLLVPIAAAGAIGLVRIGQGLDHVTRGALIALVALWGVAGPLAVGASRARVDGQVADVERPGSEVIVTDLPALPRLAWRTAGGPTWLLISADDAAHVLDKVAASDAGRVTVVLSDPDADLGEAYPDRRTVGSVRGTGVPVQILSGR